jgi:RecA-family ATPase
MPDHKQGATGNVLIMSAEDTAEDTIKPRLQAAGADEQRIINLSHALIRGEEQPLEIPADLPLIAAKIKELQARLLIIDPLMAFLCGADANKDQEIRRVLYKLSRIAEKHRCAVVCMRHLNKNSTGKAIYRGNSSIAVIGHARTGLLVAQDPDDQHKRILAVSKCNLGPRPQSLRFVLELHNGVPRVGWCGHSGYDADQLVQAPRSEEETDRKETAKRKLATPKGSLRCS